MKREQIALAAAVCLLMVVSVGAVVIAQDGGSDGLSDDFEDGDLEEWRDVTGTNNSQITTNAIDGNYSMAMSSYSEMEYRANFTVDRYSKVNSSVYMRADDIWAGSDRARFESEPIVLTDGNQSIRGRWHLCDTCDSGWGVSIGGSLVNATSFTRVGKSENEILHMELVVDMENNVTELYADSTLIHTTDITGTFDQPQNVSYRTILNSDASNRVMDATVDDVVLPGGGGLPARYDDSDLVLDSNPYMPHNSTQNYEVRLDGQDVTDDSTVTSGDTHALTVEPDSRLLNATSNRTINRKVTVTAEYRGLETTRDVTVANATVSNVDILPMWWRINAVLSDWTIIYLIAATLLAVMATKMASIYAGIGGYVAGITAGWVVGNVPSGIAVVAVFMALFVGLNLAANIDYSVKG